MGEWDMINPFDAKEIADKVLEDVVDVCDDLDIRYCLIAGTCLGFYRDSGYIPTDNDLDMWVDCAPVEGECYITFTKRLWELGFTTYHFYHFYRDKIMIDMWTEARPPLDHYRQPEFAAFAALVDRFDTIVYNGRTYNLPCPVEKYLVYQYGEDWRTPEQWF